MPQVISYSAPVPTNATRAAVCGFAEEVGAKLGVGPRTSMEDVLRGLGGALVHRNCVSYGEAKPDSIVVRDYRDFDVSIGTMTSATRNRYLVAHELGHLFLHYPLAAEAHPTLAMRATRWVDADDQVQRRCEWEANWFAAALLMPEAAFHREVAAGADDEALARTFDVGSEVLTLRRRTLGLD